VTVPAIRPVGILQIDLAPKVARAGAIRPYVAQETPIVRRGAPS
jgi:hypothetical protein